MALEETGEDRASVTGTEHSELDSLSSSYGYSLNTHVKWSLNQIYNNKSRISASPSYCQPRSEYDPFITECGRCT